MRIASIVLNNFTSDNRVLKENLSYKKAGYYPLIIAMHEEGLKREEEIEGIPIYRIKLRTKNWPKSPFLSAIKYAEFILSAFAKTKNCDAVHCNDLDTLIIGYLRKLFNRKIKLVYDAHEYEIHRTTSARPSKLWLNKKMERWFIHSANAVITVSDSIADEYKQLYRIQRPYLIYNCPYYAEPIQNKQNLFREYFGIKEHQTIFIYQGAFNMGRGIDKIIQAFQRIGNENVVVFMGYGPFQSLVEEAASKSSNIFYQPKVEIDRINEYTNSADWGLLTIENVSKSYYYSLPNKLFEYAMAGIPMIAFPMLEIERKIKEYEIGLVCDEASTDSLASAILRCGRKDAATYSQSLDRFARLYNWENQEKQLMKIIGAQD